MKSVNNIDQGALYLRIYGRADQFYEVFRSELTSNI